MLVLNVACHDHHTMDVTSHHLDVVPPGTHGTWGDGEEQDNDSGEEVSKRGERFGHPVGKGIWFHVFRVYQVYQLNSLPR